MTPRGFLVVAVSVAILVGCGGGATPKVLDANVTAPPTVATTVPPTAATTVAATTITPATTTTVVTTTTTAAPTTTTLFVPKTMPDLVGQQLSAGRAQLEKYNARITERKEIATQPAGTVIKQEPAAGAAFAINVVLTVSVVPPAVPTVIGLTVGDAKVQLEGLGFKVIELSAIDEQKADGLVVAQQPVAGTPNAGEVTVSVARRPEIRFLSQFSPVTADRAETGGEARKGNAQVFNRWIAFDARYPSTSISFDLSRGYRSLKAMLAFDDKSSDRSKAKVEFFGDGRLLGEAEATFGETLPVDLDVTGVLRLRIEVTRLGGGDSTLYLADPRLLGVAGEVPTTTVKK